MELPRLVYEDLYKFTMSLGAILFVLSIAGIASKSRLHLNPEIFYLLIFILVVSIIMMIWAWNRWYVNQKLLDRKLEAETRLIERTQPVVSNQQNFSPSLSSSASPSASQSPSPSPSPSAEDTSMPSSPQVARVVYKIASELPNSVAFDFAKEFKVWFWIFNYDPIKYLAYVKIKYIAGDYQKDVETDYYGGEKAWKLDGFSGVQAPGLGFPDEVKNAVKAGKGIKVEIRCKIHDESNNLIEEKFPQTYTYDPKDSRWFLEP